MLGIIELLLITLLILVVVFRICKKKPEGVFEMPVELPQETPKENEKFIKTMCQGCDGSIEFPASALGEMVNCPHCQKLIPLGMPSDSSVLNPAPDPKLVGNTDFVSGIYKKPIETLKEIFDSKRIKAEASKEELQQFIQNRSYHYISKWELFDPTFQKFPSGTFNWAAFFFTFFWMAYRKMYLYAIVLFLVFEIIIAVIELMLGSQGGRAGEIAVSVVFGIYGNSLFKNHTERKIREIKKTVAPEYWPQALHDTGGTNWFAIIPLLILQALSIYGGYLAIVENQKH